MSRYIDCYDETDKFACFWAETSRRSGKQRRCPWQVGLVLALGVSVGVCDLALAQIVPDATLGAEQSVVTPTDRIEGGALRGANLFHSFQEFNVRDGQRVYFANPEGIENILSRITGGNPSNILGTLGVEGAANLFLLNPNGIVFGENARLDIDGSFVASTADSFVFGNGSSFSATNPEAPPLLTLNITPGLQYGSNRAGTIANRGNLAVGRDFTLSAGHLNLQGQLQAGGDLTLQGQDTVRVRDSVTHPFVAAAGNQLLVQGNEAIDIFALNHPNSGLFAGGDMVLRSSSAVGGDVHYTAGGNFRIEQLDGNLGDLFSPNDPIIRANGDVFLASYTGASLHILAGGSVIIPGAVEITGADAANFLAETIQLSDGTAIAINGSARPTLDVRAGIDWAQRGGFPGNIVGGNLPQPPVFAGATGADIAIGSIANNFVDSGDIVLTAAGNIFTGNIESFSNGIGDAGSIRLTSDASVFIENSSVQSQTFGEGRGGDIKVKFPPKLAVRVTGAI